MCLQGWCCAQDSTDDYYATTGGASPLSVPSTWRESGERLLGSAERNVEVDRKLVVLGSRSSGKSSLCQRFAEGNFYDAYDPTIESTYQTYAKIKKVTFCCDILDTAGQDEYSNISRQAAIGAHGYMLAYSVTSRSSFRNINMIYKKLLELVGSDTVTCIVVGCKCDNDAQREVSFDEGKYLAHRIGCQFLECSAKENKNVVEAFHTLLLDAEKDSGLVPGTGKASCAIM